MTKILNNIRNKTNKYPIISSFVCVFFWLIFCFIFSSVLSSIAAKYLFEKGKTDSSFDPISAIESFSKVVSRVGYFFTIFFVLFLVWFLGKINMYFKGSFKKTLTTGLFVFLLGVLNFIEMFSRLLIYDKKEINPAIDIFFGLFEMFVVAFSEESIFRIIIFSSIAKKYAKSKAGVWFSCIISGAIFGIMHMVNISSSRNLLATVVQSLDAFTIGVCYCAIYLRGGNIWVLILMHFINNTASLFEFLFTKTDRNVFSYMNELHNISSFFIVAVIYIAISIFILRKNKPLLLLNN